MKKISILTVLLAFISVLSSCANRSLQTDDERIAISRAKEMFMATANCDVQRIKELMTPESYEIMFPESDGKVYAVLSSVPESERQSMIDMIENHSDVSAETNDQVITVRLTNELNGKEFVMCFVDEEGTGDWRVQDYQKWR